ncbi:MAG: GNAT family N-acetyltransferase [Theionarchaea archaeon]|nr:GNAT family N-acetyltransferase [Theionarchaea archaeon]
MEEPMIDIQNINDNIKDLFSPCNTCVYWEAPEKCERVTENEAFTIKKKWFEKTRAFGDCGKLLYVDGSPKAYCQYGPPHLLENVGAYTDICPVSPDAVLISCLYVLKGYRNKNLGTTLLLAVVTDIRERGYCAVETYARDDSPNNCSGPTAFYLKNRFRILKSKKWGSAVFSLVRCDLKVRVSTPDRPVDVYEH